MKEEKWLKNPESIREIAFGMFTYTSGSILAPLIIFLPAGYFLDKYFQTKPLLLIVGILLAFVVTNVLIFKKIFRLMKKLDKTIPAKKLEETSKEN